MAISECAETPLAAAHGARGKYWVLCAKVLPAALDCEAVAMSAFRTVDLQTIETQNGCHWGSLGVTRNLH
jgi:hypothetical protein